MVYFCYVLSFDNLIYLVYKFRKKFFEKSVRLWFRSCLYRCKGKNQKGGLSMNDKDIIQLYLNRDQRALSDHGKSDAGTKGFVRATQGYRTYYRPAQNP